MTREENGSGFYPGPVAEIDLEDGSRAAPHARPVPPHTVQIIGVQVCAIPLQVHPGAGTGPPV
jgi:hypothetical protein